MSSGRQRLLVFFLLAVVAKYLVEIALEFLDGEHPWEMFDDIAMFAIGLVILWMLVHEWLDQHRSIASLQAELQSARGRLAQFDHRGLQIGRAYREVMQKQFDTWQLTASEQEVVILMLKGLSFREVASLRDTREKTVRQQATSVYRKSGLSGRHELAAWFLEDLLEPRESPDD